MELNLGSWLLSFLPILTVIILMLLFKWGALRASAMSWLVAVAVSLFAFGGSWLILAWSQVKALVLAVNLLVIVWGALLLYSLASEAGTIRSIGLFIPRLSNDRSIQLLMIAWLLTSFLQGMGGFGVAVAVCAPILVGMGYSPILSIVMTTIGHGWAVSFGGMASAFESLIAVSHVSGMLIAPYAAILFALSFVPTGVIITLLGTGWKGVRHAFPAILAVSLTMSTTLYFLNSQGFWSLSTIGPSLVGIAMLVLLTRLPGYRGAKIAISNRDQELNTRDLLVHLTPYILLVVIGFAVTLIKPLNAFLNQVSISLPYPEIVSGLGFVTPAESSPILHPFSHPGMVLLVTVLLSYLVLKREGMLDNTSPRRILSLTSHNVVDASLGMIVMAGVSTIMTHVGMTSTLARGIAETINGVIYPAVVPFIGVIGAFLTGTNNNSNILFGALQTEAARLLKLNVPLILAAQNAGGSMGSVMSPTKLIVSCITVGLGGQEGKVLRKLIGYGLIPIIVIALATSIWSWLLNGGA
jgi:lactate permease